MVTVDKVGELPQTKQLKEQVIRCRMNRQHSCLLTKLTTFTMVFFFFLNWIEKRYSRGHLSEHLESSGSKIMMRGPIVSQL